MPDDCDKLDCCPEEAYGYEAPKENPQPPALPTYTLTVDSGTVGGSIAPGTADYTENTFATITATPEEGYEFIEWLGDVAGNQNPMQVYMDQDKTVSANFSLINYFVTINIEPAGSATVTGGGSHPYGNTAVISTTPESGFTFTGYTGDLETIDNPADLFIDGNKTVTANLAQNTVELTLSANPSGAGLPTGAGTYAEGAVVNVSSNPNENFCFEYWSGDISSADDPASVTMSANKSVTANYSELLFWEYIFEDEVSRIFPLTVNALGPLEFEWELGNPPDSTTQLIIEDQDFNVLYSSAYLSDILRTGTINTGYTITTLYVTINISGASVLPFNLRYFRINSSCIP